MKYALKLCMLWWCALAGQASAVPLSDRPWVLQFWGKPDTVADAAPNAKCGPQSPVPYLFSKTRTGGGGAELIIPSVLVPGKAYELVLPVKLMQGSGAVDVFLRRDSPYYETTSIRTVTLTPQWQNVVVRGVYDVPVPGSVRVALRNDGMAVCLGKPELKEINPDVVGADDSWHPVSEHFFGIHLNKLGRHNGWPTFEPDVLRMWATGTSWAEMQPKEGPIDWRRNPHAQRLDYFVRHAAIHGRNTSVMMTLAMTPPWAAAPGDNGACATSPFGSHSCMPLANLESWRKFVRELAERYDGGRINIWEVWNESDVPPHWLGPMPMLVDMTRIASEEVKKADRQNLIIGPNIGTNGLKFLNEFLLAGGAKHVDGISVHAYLAFGSAWTASRLRNVREMLRAHGVNLPIWNTESNTACGEQTPPGGAIGCDPNREEVILQSAIVQAAMGIENFTFYTWEGSEVEVGGQGLVKADYRTNTRLGDAYEQLARLLRGASLKTLPSGPGSLTRVQWMKKSKRCVIAWSAKGQTTVSPSVFELDDMVRDITGRPAQRDMTGAWLVGPMPVIGCAQPGESASRN